MLEGISLDLAIESFSFLFIASLVYKKKITEKMELRWSHIVHLYNVFLKNDGKENCAQLIEEEFNKMFGVKSLNDEHDCNVVSMNYLNIQNANDDRASHEKNVSYKHVNFCGVERLCEDMPYRDDIYFVRSINMIEPIFCLK